MEDLFEKYEGAFRKILVEEHGYTEVGEYFLRPCTMDLIAELEDFNRQNLIERALEVGDRELFIKLTSEVKDYVINS